MARKPEGWTIRWRDGIAHVRWRHDGRRRSVSTGETNPTRARETAARLYTEALAGRRKIVQGLPSRQSTAIAIAAWLDEVEATHDERTVHEFKLNADKHWVTRWKTLGEVSVNSIAEYQQARLREVTRETTRKHMVALRTFLVWCKERGLLVDVPEIPKLPVRAAGKRARPVRQRKPISPNDVAKLLKALPEWSSDNHGRTPYRVRDYIALAWETALRPATLARLRTPEHYERKRGHLTITPDIDKARFARELPLTPAAIAALNRCLPEEPGLIFGEHEIADYLEVASKKALKRIVTPYDLRHSRITWWVSQGADLLGIQHLAGHKDLSTTARYAHSSKEAAKRALKKAG